MSLTKLSQDIIKILCSNNGSMYYKDLHRKLSGSNAVSDMQLTMILRNSNLFTIVQGTGQKAVGSELTLDSQVIATSSIRVCKDYPNKKCEDCGQLHLCRFFIFGNCKYAEESDACKYSHTTRDIHNWGIVRVNQLQELNMDELRILLLQNDPSLLPQVCLHYNRGSGDPRFGNCAHKHTCNKLHICSFFASGNCKFGAECRRSHSFHSNDASTLLKKFSLDENVIRNLQLIYQNRYQIKQALSTDGMNAASQSALTGSQRNSATDEICLYFIRNHCNFKERCSRVHFNLPYRWQIFKEMWQDVRNMEMIEEEFSEPNNTTSSSEPTINFETMMCASHRVRRLSTASSVTKPPHFILTTEWLWYMKDMFGKWTQYENCDHVNVTSEDLEVVYLANSNAEVNIGEFNETLTFKEMIQKDKFSGSVSEVRRRPRFISKEDVETKISSIQLSQGPVSSGKPKNIPENWDKSALPNIGYKRIHLSPLSKEYQDIQALFHNSMSSSKVHKIDRIQNRGLWEIFQWWKEQLRVKNDNHDVNEQLLFHGITDHSIVDAICCQNFDWGSFTQDGTLYGKGRYFAKEASCANFDLHSDSATNFNIMFLARVLVGQFTKGLSSYDQPPSKGDRRLRLYDSCVDCTDNPSVFVIFEKFQIYPEYVIEYSSNSM
ncbi:protein mono-ADP-ribosyltransferase PARP12-like isoform X1 [Scyliorhinus canicula]|uniref:protein mono-ADP-ribosyltransferase PARP12-like isoform X1 n=1 Tax=Scyliorhinus canicula TaxID=7830 RepID=UPI0018F424DC|nr:protein mono-ADP-ribosyltransferase PARP12-like isoform X1 [Scyliorhinus canicula]